MENSEAIRQKAEGRRLWTVTLNAVFSTIGVLCCFIMGLPEAVCGIAGTYFVLVACFMVSALLDPQGDPAYAHRVKALLLCMVAAIAITAVIYIVR